MNAADKASFGSGVLSRARGKEPSEPTRYRGSSPQALTSPSRAHKKSSPHCFSDQEPLESSTESKVPDGPNLVEPASVQA